MLPSDTVTPLRKPVPLTVKVKAALPATTLDGAMLVIVGVGGVMVSATALEAAPPALAAVICTVAG